MVLTIITVQIIVYDHITKQGRVSPLAEKLFEIKSKVYGKHKVNINRESERINELNLVEMAAEKITFLTLYLYSKTSIFYVMW